MSTDVLMAQVRLTTAWRLKRKLEQGATTVYQQRKLYSCKKCGQPNTAATGHSKHRSFVFCPNLGQTREWVADTDRRMSENK